MLFVWISLSSLPQNDTPKLGQEGACLNLINKMKAPWVWKAYITLLVLHPVCRIRNTREVAD